MKEGIIDENRALALDRAFVAGRLLGEKFYPRVMDALNDKEKGLDSFHSVCVDAGIPKEMIHPLWNSLNTYAASTKAPWAPC